MAQYLVGTGNGILLVNDMNLTTHIDKATLFPKIGDAMRECVRLNNANLGFAVPFRVIPFG